MARRLRTPGCGWRALDGGAAVRVAPLPARPAQPGGGFGVLLRIPAVRIGLAVIVLVVTAHFAAYTYVRPALEHFAGFGATELAVMLLVYGIFGVAGNFASGAGAQRSARRTLLVLAGGIGIALLGVQFVGTTTLGSALTTALWGAAYGGLSVCGQILTAQTAPEHRESVTGLYVGVFTASIASGAFVGGVVIDHSGLPMLLWLSAAVAIAGVALATRVPAAT
ncbi:putative MFS family arabinose efflux permease [Rhodococcus sp. 27YEA15]|uniref:MFS transporter n=1 Tax=Rhodococcus sp. 27YEA15 TaxID=3156259 RepID=UPI003C7AB4D3